MTDIVERLREVRGVLDNRWPGPTPMDLEAAEAIERLRTALEEIIKEVGTSTKANKIASAALASVGKENADG